MPDFVTLTLVINGAQVIMLPLIAGGLWRITASQRFIGAEYRNRWWENLVMAVLFALAVSGAAASVQSLFESPPTQLTAADKITQVESQLADHRPGFERNAEGQIVGIDLSTSLVSDSDLRGLEWLPELRTLNLADCRITDFGLYHLRSLDQLEQLDLRRTQVTETGAMTLQQSLPNCVIEH